MARNSLNWKKFRIGRRKMKQNKRGGRTNSPKLFRKSNTLTKSTFSSVFKLFNIEEMLPRGSPLSRWITPRESKEKIKPEANERAV